jgi:Ser-tRNA(Ala) deacylase AlaX
MSSSSPKAFPRVYTIGIVEMPFNSCEPGEAFRLEVNGTYIYRMLRDHGGLTFVFKDVAAADRWAAHMEERVAWYFRLQTDLTIPQREAKAELDAAGSFYNMCRVETLAYFLEHPEDLDETVGMVESPRKNKEVFGRR